MSLPPEREPPPKSPAGPRRRPFEGWTPPAPARSLLSPQVFTGLALLCVLVILVGRYALKSGALSRPKPAPAAGPSSAKPSVPAAPSAEELAARDVRLHTLFEGSLADTKNGQDFEETPGYRHMLEILARYPADEVARLATKKLDRAAVLADPDASRGDFVWTRGILAHRYAVRLREPVAGVQDVYQVILTEGSGEDAVIVDMLEEPPPVELRKEAVDVQGILYRTVRYENSGPRPTAVTVPYLLARTMKPVEAPRGDRTGILRDPAAAILVGMALALVAARLIIYSIQRRARRPGPDAQGEPAGFRKMFEKRFDRGESTRLRGPRPDPP